MQTKLEQQSAVAAQASPSPRQAQTPDLQTRLVQQSESIRQTPFEATQPVMQLPPLQRLGAQQSLSTAQVPNPRQLELQDFVSLPARLNAQLMFLILVVDAAEPAVIGGARQRFADLEAEWAVRQEELREILQEIDQSPG